MQHVISVENIKCAGCMNSIKKALMHVPGVSNVDIDKDIQQVVVESPDAGDRGMIVDKLASLGYPEAGNNDLFKKARSFVSCAIGRLD